jgi:NADH:ubiquinone oxidoreductase subunit B-like Fe-S oxidoreductase
MWLATFGLACCAIEMMQTAGPRHDLRRLKICHRLYLRAA